MQACIVKTAKNMLSSLHPICCILCWMMHHSSATYAGVVVTFVNAHDHPCCEFSLYVFPHFKIWPPWGPHFEMHDSKYDSPIFQNISFQHMTPKISAYDSQIFQHMTPKISKAKWSLCTVAKWSLST